MSGAGLDLSCLAGVRAPDPVGAYERGVVRNGLGFLSGQFPVRDGKLIHAGRVGAEISEAQGVEAAEVAAINALAQLDVLLQGFDTLEGLLRLDGYVASADHYWNQPRVLDGASKLLLGALGGRGRHARTAFSVQRLPMNAPIELAVTFAARRA